MSHNANYVRRGFGVVYWEITDKEQHEKIDRMGVECVENKFLKLPNIQKYEVVHSICVPVAPVFCVWLLVVKVFDAAGFAAGA